MAPYDFKLFLILFRSTQVLIKNDRSLTQKVKPFEKKISLTRMAVCHLVWALGSTFLVLVNLGSKRDSMGTAPMELQVQHIPGLWIYSLI